MAGHALDDWLRELERRSPQSRIDLGLDRVAEVGQRLGVTRWPVPVVSVAGTNGKGSVVAMIEGMARAAGHRTFAYSSPHLVEFSERMRVDGAPADTASIVAALEAVDEARGEVALTWFEHVTLAALVLAQRQQPDLLVLEVGLGGRLDAVNIVDADVAVITSIGLDHLDWLGPTRDDIGREKAGIGRSGRPVIIGERDRPDGLMSALRESGARMRLAGPDFDWHASARGLTVQVGEAMLELPQPALAGDWQLGNAACAVAAVVELAGVLAIDAAAMATGLRQARLPGRFQRLGRAPEVLVDVAHNEAAARVLARALGAPSARSFAVFSALAGKDIQAIAAALDGCFTDWLVTGMAGARGLDAVAIERELAAVPVTGRRETVESVSRAVDLALERAEDCDRIVVFGSFMTVSEAWPTLIDN